MHLKHVLSVGILSAALGLAPLASAQTSGSSTGSTADTQSQPQTSSPSGSQPSSQPGSQSGTTSGSSSQSGGSGADQEAVRQHLSAARQSLAELTKLPAATQLQGESREQVANLISNFNAFATATTDWKSKYQVVDQALDQLLGTDGGTTAAAASASAPSGTQSEASASTSSTGATDPAASASAAGTTGGAESGDLDPAIKAKLQEVRTHLDAFEGATGDPTFVVEKIEKILDQASGGASGSGPTAVGTSGSASAGSASGSVTLDQSQLSEIRRHLDSIKQAAAR
jgi:hypothetical protein